jgi:L-seryl-tRNA(Ser) seleniumtransferase
MAWFNTLPTVNDLLETPALKNLLEQVGRNKVVTETGKFLDRMRVEVQNSARRVLPVSPQELAQRVARWITSPQTSSPTFINGTGIFFTSGYSSHALATEAIDAIANVWHHSHEIQSLRAQTSSLIQQELSCDSLVFHSSSTAMLATLLALAQDKEIIISRGSIESDPLESSIADWCASFHLKMKEVGTLNSVSENDYAAGITPLTGAFVFSMLRWTHVSGDKPLPDFTALANLAQKQNIPFILDAGWVGLVEGTRYGIQNVPSAQQLLSQGVDLVLVRGNGLLGGPECGILLGKSAILEKIAKHALTKSMLATAGTLVALVETIKLQKNMETAELQVPLLRMLATTPENLKQRAERLAPQIAASGLVPLAEAIPSQAYLSQRQAAEEQIPSWAISLAPKEESVVALQDKLRNKVHSIMTKIVGERLLIDLRTVSPDQDLFLVDAN